MTLKVGLIGMADNSSTRVLLYELNKLHCVPDLIVLQKPDLRGQWVRFTRKLRTAGFILTAKRVLDTLSYLGSNQVLKDPKESSFLPDKIYYVTDINGPQCHKVLKEGDLDVILLCTDTMVRRTTFSLPRYGAINAHPGWIPRYRGLGSTLAMLRDGYLPAISVHFVDEGVDTGPLLLRGTITEDVIGEGEYYERNWLSAQARMFVDALELIAQNNWELLDTFFERSNMTRGMPHRLAKKIIQKAVIEKEQLVAIETTLDNRDE